MNRHRLFRNLACAVSVLGLATNANAASTTTTFTVTATVNNACTVSANNIAFGTYNPLLITGMTALGAVDVTCTLGSTYQIGLNQGTATGATVTTRKMTNGSNTLSYALYRDLAQTQNWGNTLNTDTVTGLGTGLGIPSIVYANLAGSQNVPSSGSPYSDTITVTLTY